jgi:hypothetical protein
VNGAGEPAPSRPSASDLRPRANPENRPVRSFRVVRLCLLSLLTVALAGAAGAQVPAPPVTTSPASPLDSYADAASTTIIAEQACPGLQVRAGQLTTLRLAARVNAGQEAALEAKLRSRAVQVRQQLAAIGREAWCAEALAAFGPQGTVAKGILVSGASIR